MYQMNHRSILIVMCIGGFLMLTGCGGELTNSTVQISLDQIESSPTAATDSEKTVPSQNTKTIRSTLESIAPASSISTASPTSRPLTNHTGNDAQPSSESDGIIVDHHSVDLFDSIPDEYIAAAAEIDMIFIDRSVGANINDGLACLMHDSNSSAPGHCSRTQHAQTIYNVDPSVVHWSRPGGYDRSNWFFEGWSGDRCAQWYEKIDCFFQMMQGRIDNYDVVSYQLSYLAVDQGSSIIDQPGGFFWDNPERADVFDQLIFESQYPDKIFIYWTTSLARGIGSSESDLFNEQMRQFSFENGKVLFDVADILSHDPKGSPCYDNRDGIPYDNGNRSENYPDDEQAYLAICPHYTTEVNGGHLGSVSAGKIRVAKAFWVLMARIAGWN